MWDMTNVGLGRFVAVARRCVCLGVIFCLSATALGQVRVVAGATVADGAEAGHGGFTVPQVDEDFTTALGDFERYSGKSEWEKAFRALSQMREADPGRLCRAGDGLIVPVRRRVWEAVVTLPAEGRRAFDVFYGGQASALADRMNAPANRGSGEDVTAAHELFSQYFISSHGVTAADLLGDNAYEQGYFADAATYWRAILDHHDTDDATGARVGVKLAFALARAGQTDAFGKQRDLLDRRYGDQNVTLGGRSMTVPEALILISKPGEGHTSPASNTDNSTMPAEAPADDAQPLWRVQFMSDASQQSLSEAMRNWWGPASGLSGLVPAYDTDGDRIYCNWLGVCFAIDARTGKLLWRSNKFSELNGKFNQFQHGSAIATRYEIAVAGDSVVALTLPLDRLNHWREPYSLTVMNPKNGQTKWQTGGLSWLNQTAFVGRPLVDEEQIIAVTHPKEGAEATLRALSLKDGRQLWEIPLGQAVMINTPRGQQYIPDPTLMRDGDQMYVLTNNGALLNIDIPRRRIAWAFAYPPPPGTGDPQNNRFWGGGPSDMGRLHTRGVMRFHEGVLYFKESGSPTLYALDPARKKLVWKRPVNADATIVAMDADKLYLLGDELLALDRGTRGLKWSTKMPIGAGRLRVLQDDKRIMVFTGRGVYEVDKANGDVIRIFRGHDLGSQGGSVFALDGKLVSISNHTLCAYAPGSPGSPATPATPATPDSSGH